MKLPWRRALEYSVNEDLLFQARSVLAKNENLYWIIGGAGSGKTTVSQILSEQHNIAVYDMDAHIYGAYHKRFSKSRHPANHVWAQAPNGLQWLLSMNWAQFEGFSRAALPEYLDLLAEDIQKESPKNTVIVDGGIWTPSLLAQVLPKEQIVCLAISDGSTQNIWEENAERREMKEMVARLPAPDVAWHQFTEFDRRISKTILAESIAAEIPVVYRDENVSQAQFSDKVSRLLGL